ncbi:unnamed protein product [Phytomonas sp. EM1]|nr:unnamed protein product [Phytomonas sp. EM1]|eukprot:CCW63325.1 unnamed protein product [Phytomonas sp. isolate EM1]
MTEDSLAAIKSFFHVNATLSALQVRLERYQGASGVLREAAAALEAVRSFEPLVQAEIPLWGQTDRLEDVDEGESLLPDEEDASLSPCGATADEMEEETALIREWLATLGDCPAAASLAGLSNIAATLAGTRLTVDRKSAYLCARLTHTQQRIQALQDDVRRVKERVGWLFRCPHVALELEVACAQWLCDLAQGHCPTDGDPKPAESDVPGDGIDALLSREDLSDSAKNFWVQLEQSHRMIWAILQGMPSRSTERELYRQRLQQQRARTLNACQHALANFSGRL